MTERPIPTTERLARALEAAGAPQEMIARARGGFYDEFKSDLATPIVQLVQDAREAGLKGIAERAIDGEFDATKEESDAWAESPEGQEVMRQFMGEARQQKPSNPSSHRKKRWLRG
jgi:hypothetical protein